MPRNLSFVLVYLVGNSKSILKIRNKGPPLWSSGQSFLAKDPEARVRFPALPEKKM
jgi:hypothetical protein